MREEQEKQVLVDLLTVAARLKLPMLVVGAGARILIFDRRYNVEGRATTDLDFAVRVDSWSDYQSLSAEMTHGSNPCFRATYIPHKFIHIQTETEVDIVPFGPIGQPNQIIEWSNGNQMSFKKILSQILQNSNTLFPQLIYYTFDTEEWDAKFDIIVRCFEALQRGIEYINYRQTS